MVLSPINTVKTSTQPSPVKKKPNYVKITGYAAVAAGVGSAVAGNRKKIKLHKNLAYLTGLFTAAHIVILEWYHHLRKSKTK